MLWAQDCPLLARVARAQDSAYLVARDKPPLGAGRRHGDQAQEAARGAVARGRQRQRARHQLLRLRARHALPGKWD